MHLSNYCYCAPDEIRTSGHGVHCISRPTLYQLSHHVPPQPGLSPRVPGTVSVCWSWQPGLTPRVPGTFCLSVLAAWSNSTCSRDSLRTTCLKLCWCKVCEWMRAIHVSVRFEPWWPWVLRLLKFFIIHYYSFAVFVCLSVSRDRAVCQRGTGGRLG